MTLAAGDGEGYRKAAGRLWDRYSGEQFEYLLSGTARACALGPGAVTDTTRLVELAGKDPNRDRWRIACIALAHYRAGQYQRALNVVRDGKAEDWVIC